MLIVFRQIPLANDDSGQTVGQRNDQSNKLPKKKVTEKFCKNKRILLNIKPKKDTLSK